MARILVVEDERGVRMAIQRTLARVGHDVTDVGSIGEARAALGADADFDLVITDINLGDGSGIDLLRGARKDGFDGIGVAITAQGTIETAVEAMKSGADDFLQKPLKMEELPLKVDRWMGQRRLARRLTLYERLEATRDQQATPLGESDAWKRALSMAERLASLPIDHPDQTTEGTDAGGGALPTILLLGETGSGKGVLARHIHDTACRNADPKDSPPFVHVNCSALPASLVEAELFGHEKGAFTDAREAKPGLFEMADSGTIFLDEISEMPLALQAKLLLVVEQGRFRRVGGTRDRSVRARVIAASNLDLEQRVEDGEFRRDLLYRLNAFTVRIPPLRERAGDALALAESMLPRFARRYGRGEVRLSGSARHVIGAYRWPGNVRELVNAMQRAAMLAEGDVIQPEDLGIDAGMVRDAGDATHADSATVTGAGAIEFDFLHGSVTADELERRLIECALEHTRGNVSGAAKLIGLTRASMRYRVERHGLGDSVKEAAQQ